MANGVSGQNFLRLLFGGAQQGIGEFRRQQGREVDLLLTLQNMLEQRGQREFQQGVTREQLGSQKAAAERAKFESDRAFRFSQEQAAAAESERLRASTRETVERNRELLVEDEQRRYLVKLGEKYPGLGPAIDVALMGNVSLGQALRAFGDTMTDQVAPTQKDMDARADFYMKLWAQNPETRPTNEGGTEMTFQQMRQYSRQLARQDLTGETGGGFIDRLSLEDIDAAIEQTRSELLKFK